MPEISDIEIPPKTDDKEFESLCLDIWRKIWRDPYAQKNGTPGQEQSGVDVFGRISDTLDWVGVQCKVKSCHGKLTEHEVRDEVVKAKTFNPGLSQYIIATTAKRDQCIQTLARQITQEHSEQKLFSVSVYSWEEISDLLKQEEYRDIFQKYYHKFFVDWKILGNTIGKIINLEIGVGNKRKSRYELFIGKASGSDGYYQDSYLLGNLTDRKLETFPRPCYVSDIIVAIPFKFDANIIAHWLNSIRDLDQFIYSNEKDLVYYLPIDELEKYFRENDEID